MISLGPIAVASNYPFTDDAALVVDEARHVEALGYAALWRSGNLPMLAAAVRATNSMPVATGIIPVDRVPANDVVDTYTDLQRDHPERFIVGIGGAHGTRPLETLNSYLDALDAAGISSSSRILAALGQRMLALARDRTAGAYPYLVTPSYVANARTALGPDRRLAILLMAMPTTDREAARRAAATPLEFLAGQGGYRRNLIRQGFTEIDIDTVSDRLLDGITAWGPPERIAERIGRYREAGADQVVLRILGVDDLPLWRSRLAHVLLG